MGENNYGQLGDGTFTNNLTPIKIVAEHVEKVYAFDVHSAFIKKGGSVWMMGGVWNYYSMFTEVWLGQHIPDLKTMFNTPTLIYTNDAKYVTLGENGMLVYKQGNTLQNLPLPIHFSECDQAVEMNPYFTDNNPEKRPYKISKISSGKAHILYMMSDGTLHTGGRSDYGARGRDDWKGYHGGFGRGPERSNFPQLSYTPKTFNHPKDTSNHLFRIQGNQLITTQPLDFETQPTHKIHVAAINSEGLHITKTFTIQVKGTKEP